MKEEQNHKPKHGTLATNSPDTSWGSVAREYHGIVGSLGHFYHKEVILPKLHTLLDVHNQDLFVDLGCGQGVFEKSLPKQVEYLGIDISKELIALALSGKKSNKHAFVVADLTKPELPKPVTPYLGKANKAVAILSLQNMSHPEIAIRHASNLLGNNGIFAIVLNHPCFRIPRLSSWEYDENQKLMYRKIHRYLSSQKIPIQNNPSKKQSALTWSFHFPLSFWSSALKTHGFCITDIEEWTSPKNSYGKRSKAENLARKEFPLFLALKARKLS